MEATGDALAEEVSEVILAETENVLELRGSVGGPVTQTLFHQARRLERHTAAAVRCDRLTSLDASALQVLLALHRTLQEHGHILELRAVPPTVFGQLRAAGAADVLCISTEAPVPLEPPDETVESPDEVAEASTAADDTSVAASVEASLEANESVDDAGWSLVPENRDPPEES